MRWRLSEPHHIDEQVLDAGTIIGDDTQWPYRATKDDPKINRKKGDPLPPSTNMIPLDQEATEAWDKKWGDRDVGGDPFKSVPLTGAPDAPIVRGPANKPQPEPPKPVNTKPAEPPKTGILAPKEEPKPTPTHPSTPTPKA
jgi:hypothetical protein